MAHDDIRHLDKPWSFEKLSILIDGEIEIDGDVYQGLTAYELRMAAESTTRDFADMIVEVAQLDRSIQEGILRDHEVRIAMLLRTRGGYDEHEIEQMLGSNRPGYALLARGIELLRRHERSQHSKLQRVRANRGLSDQPVCWKCLENDVKRPGDWCGCVEKQHKSFRSKTGPGSTYDPTDRPPVGEMSEEERLQEIAKLEETQSNAPIPGGEHYRKRVQPVGTTMYDPDDLRRADRAYRRGRSDDYPFTTEEQVPSV